MNIVVFGSEEDLHECAQKFGGQHQYLHGVDSKKSNVSSDNIVFDFMRDHNGSKAVFPNATNGIAFINAAVQLPAKISEGSYHFGFAGLPGFLNREIFEVTLANSGDYEKLKETCDQLGTKFQVVENRIGLVTPRVICMIINEAYFAVEQGTATREDVDKAMKLGTNYPYGPFEWCQRIGHDNVVALLKAVYLDTHDERYKICPLLQQAEPIAGSSLNHKS